MKFGIKEVMDVTFYDVADGRPVLFLDTLKISNMENIAETVVARGGKGNARLLTWDFSREINMQIQDALMSFKSLSLLAGDTATTGVQNLHIRDAGPDGMGYVCAGTTFTIRETPQNPGPTTMFVYALDAHGNEVSALTRVASVPTAAQFSSTAKIVTIGGTPGTTRYVVYYQYLSTATANTLTISTDKFPGVYKMVGDTVVRNQSTGSDEGFQLLIPRAKLTPGFTMTFQAEGDPSLFDFNLEVLKNPGTTEMIQLIRYDLA